MPASAATQLLTGSIKYFNRNRAFMPFTRPPRDCIGRNFAMMEMRTIIMYLVSALARCRRVSDAYQF